MDNHTKNKIGEKLHERYNPNAVGQIEAYPPCGAYFVTLYFQGNFTMGNYFNVKVEEKSYNFLISNIAKVRRETNVTVKIVEK